MRILDEGAQRFVSENELDFGVRRFDVVAVAVDANPRSRQGHRVATQDDEQNAQLNRIESIKTQRLCKFGYTHLQHGQSAAEWKHRRSSSKYSRRWYYKAAIRPSTPGGEMYQTFTWLKSRDPAHWLGRGGGGWGSVALDFRDNFSLPAPFSDHHISETKDARESSIICRSSGWLPFLFGGETTGDRVSPKNYFHKILSSGNQRFWFGLFDDATIPCRGKSWKKRQWSWLWPGERPVAWSRISDFIVTSSFLKHSFHFGEKCQWIGYKTASLFQCSGVTLSLFFPPFSCRR